MGRRWRSRGTPAQVTIKLLRSIFTSSIFLSAFSWRKNKSWLVGQGRILGRLFLYLGIAGRHAEPLDFATDNENQRLFLTSQAGEEKGCRVVLGGRGNAQGGCLSDRVRDNSSEEGLWRQKSGESTLPDIKGLDRERVKRNENDKRRLPRPFLRGLSSPLSRV